MISFRFGRITSYYIFLLQNTEQCVVVTAVPSSLCSLLLTLPRCVWAQHSKTNRGGSYSWNSAEWSKSASSEGRLITFNSVVPTSPWKQAVHSLFRLVHIKPNLGGLATLWLMFTYQPVAFTFYFRANPAHFFQLHLGREAIFQAP